MVGAIVFGCLDEWDSSTNGPVMICSNSRGPLRPPLHDHSQPTPVSALHGVIGGPPTPTLSWIASFTMPIASNSAETARAESAAQSSTHHSSELTTIIACRPLKAGSEIIREPGGASEQTLCSSLYALENDDPSEVPRRIMDHSLHIQILRIEGGE